MVREINGIKTLVANVGTPNQSVQMGVISDIIEAVKDLKKEALGRRLMKEHSTLVRDKDGKPLCVVSSMRNITPQK